MAATFLTAAAGPLRAQSADDSVAVSRALGANLPADVRAVLRARACGSPTHPCRAVQSDSVPDPLMNEIARVSGARLVSRADGPLACAWGYDPPRAGAGYIASLAAMRWSEPPDTVYVMVGIYCDNPPGYLHDVFSRTDEYAFVRAGGGEWRLLWKRARSIT